MNCLRCGKPHKPIPDPDAPRYETWADPDDGHFPETWQTRARSLAVTLALAADGLRCDDLRGHVLGWIDAARPSWEPLIRVDSPLAWRFLDEETP